MSEDWVIECSDDENYDTKNKYRIVNGKRIWEPLGPIVSQLFQQIEKKGIIDLIWQCPGRRSPSVNSVNFNIDKKTNESSESQSKASVEPNEFDFDEEFTTDLPSKVSVPKRKSAGSKKVAKLDKVMNDIRRYKIMDQQTQQSQAQTMQQQQQTRKSSSFGSETNDS